MRPRPHQIIALGAAAWILAAGFDLVHSSGEVGMTEKNGSGCVCHAFTPSSGVQVWIEGPDSIAAGTTGGYLLVMTGGPAAAGGFNAAAARGALAEGDATSKLLDPGTGGSLELTHAAPKAFANDTVRWAFRYTAPAAPGADTLFSVGNSVDLNHTPNGDAWNFGGRKVVAVLPDTAVAVAETPWPVAPLLLRAYPNPFNPATHLVCDVAAPGRVRLEIFSIRGEQVATLIDRRLDRGEYAVSWNAGSASSGVYLARLETASGSATRKLLLLR